eukprot:TRINITY_DN30483_c1_g1_i1.p1 TRINITY_DN30483_c1_g1~~TRINITY_DN30483_c1_g1_i1.p1  ORF type:complete len:1257 (+),score=272.85 TRINITY_DN30483_c1_g1_i1:82-3771(+)
MPAFPAASSRSGAQPFVCDVRTDLRPTADVTAAVELERSEYLLTGDRFGYLHAWNCGDKADVYEPVFTLEAHTARVTRLVVLRNPKLPEAMELRVLEDLEGHHRDVEVQREERGFIGRLKDFFKGKKPVAAPEHVANVGKVNSLHWFVASVGDDGGLRLWRWSCLGAATGAQAGKSPFQVDFYTQWTADGGAAVADCRELHDGYLALCLQGCCDILLLDPVTATLRSRLYGHTGPVSALAECSDGRLASGAADGAVRLWQQKMWAEGSGGGEGQPTPAPLPQPTTPAKSLSTVPKAGSFRELVEGVTEIAVPMEEHDPLSKSAPIGNMGVCSEAFYSHRQQATKGECVAMRLRVNVRSADSLCSGDLPPTTCVQISVVEGAGASGPARTPSSSSGRWDFRCSIPLPRVLVAGAWTLPECLSLDFEVHQEHGSKSEPLAHFSIPVAAALAESLAGRGGRGPQKRALHSPLGRGPFPEVKGAWIAVAFIQSTSDAAIDCLIDGMDGLPRGTYHVVYRVVHSRLSELSAERRIPPRFQYRTKTVEKTHTPTYNEVLEVDIPACLAGLRIYSQASLQVVVDVLQPDSKHKKPDEVVATVSIPLKKILDLGDQVAPFGLRKASGSMAAPPRLSSKQNARVAAEDDATAGRIFLNFQAVMPCPMQLRCTVERGIALPVPVDCAADGCFVRVRPAHGDPLLPHRTMVKTSVCNNSLWPEWNQRLNIKLPPGILQSVGTTKKRHSVNMGWEHEGGPCEVALCVDVYHQASKGSAPDMELASAAVPLRQVLSLAQSPDASASKPRPVRLNCSTKSQIFMGYQVDPGLTTLTVILSHAEKLPPLADNKPVNSYCVLRISELGGFAEPTDKALQSHGPELRTDSCNTPSLEAPVWCHEDIIELPGIEREGRVKTQPNWHVLVEVVKPNSWVEPERVLAHASLALTDLLSEVAALENPDLVSNAVTAPVLNAQHRHRQETGPPKRLIKKLRLSLPGEELVEDAVPGAGVGLGDETAPDESSLRLAALGDTSFSTPSSPWMGDTATGPMVVVSFEVVARQAPLVEAASPRKLSGVLGNRDRQVRLMNGPSPVTSLLGLVSSVVAGYENGNVFIWDTTGSTPVPLHGFEAHRVPVTSLAFIGAMDTLVTTGTAQSREELMNESVLRFWSCSTLNLRHQFTLQGASARCLHSLEGPALRAAAAAVPPGAEKSAAVIAAGGYCRALLAVGADMRQARRLQLLRLA